MLFLVIALRRGGAVVTKLTKLGNNQFIFFHCFQVRDAAASQRDPARRNNPGVTVLGRRAGRGRRGGEGGHTALHLLAVDGLLVSGNHHHHRPPRSTSRWLCSPRSTLQKTHTTPPSGEAQGSMRVGVYGKSSLWLGSFAARAPRARRQALRAGQVARVAPEVDQGALELLVEVGVAHLTGPALLVARTLAVHRGHERRAPAQLQARGLEARGGRSQPGCREHRRVAGLGEVRPPEVRPEPLVAGAGAELEVRAARRFRRIIALEQVHRRLRVGLHLRLREVLRQHDGHVDVAAALRHDAGVEVPDEHGCVGRGADREVPVGVGLHRVAWAALGAVEAARGRDAGPAARVEAVHGRVAARVGRAVAAGAAGCTGVWGGRDTGSADRDDQNKGECGRHHGAECVSGGWHVWAVDLGWQRNLVPRSWVCVSGNAGLRGRATESSEPRGNRVAWCRCPNT